MGFKDKSFTSLEKAIELGFTDFDHIKKDPDLVSLRYDSRFKKILSKAEKANSKKEKIAEKRTTIAQAEVVDGVVMVSESNLVWDASLMSFVAYFKLPEDIDRTLPVKKGETPTSKKLREWYSKGTASGNYGDFYDNRDRDHSNMQYGNYPYLTRIEYSQVAKDNTLDRGVTQRIMFNTTTIGNASLSGHWSIPRLLMHQQVSMMLEYTKYMRNHLYFYPEHKDHDTIINDKGPGKGDTYPANTPYCIISQGSSGTDRPFLHAVADTLAAFHPDTKEVLKKYGILMPTIQMIFRSSQKTVKKSGDYLSGIAHPTVFDKKNLDPMKMIEMAHDMKVDSIPPVVQLKVVKEDQAISGRDFFDPVISQALFTTPCAIARVMRSNKYEYRIVVSAESSKDMNGKPLTWNWVVLRGDKDRIKINKENKEGSVVELIIPYHTRKPIAPGSELESSRVDIGVFVNNGKYYSAPGFVTFFFLDNEKRLYDKNHKIISVDYGAKKSNYVDPLVSAKKNWKDEYQYDKKGKILGWKRIRGTDIQEFTAEGGLLLERDGSGRPLSARKVNYKLDKKDVRNATLKQEDTDLIFYYWYPSETSMEGKIISKGEYEKRKSTKKNIH